MLYLIVGIMLVLSEFSSPFTHFTPMKKTYTLLLSLLLVLGTTQAFSQELVVLEALNVREVTVTEILLRPDTIAFVGLDLKNFDFDRFAESQVGRIDSLFTTLNYDPDSREAINREAKTLIASKLNLIRPLYQMFVMATKLDEIYVVSYAKGLETAPVIVATPLEGKSKSQIALIESFFENAPIKPFQHGGLLVLAVPCSPDKGKAAAEWVQKRFQEGYVVTVTTSSFFAVDEGFSDDVIFRAIVVKPENIQELLDSTDLSNVPPQAKIMLDMVLEKFQWISFGFDPYAFSARLTVQTSSETDATELLELLRGMQDAGIEAMRIGLFGGITQGARENPGLVFLAEYVPLFMEIVRGAVRQTLPQINGAKLIFSVSGDLKREPTYFPTPSINR